MSVYLSKKDKKKIRNTVITWMNKNKNKMIPENMDEYIDLCTIIVKKIKKAYYE